jgi:bifunctional DNA-binding transcriptional regulator/antitoxin component of YhaV-PrlF toxin-antitoxin module
VAVVQVVDGRVTLPAEVRARLGLLPRDPLLFSAAGDRVVAVRATPPAAACARGRAPRRTEQGRGRPGEGSLPSAHSARIIRKSEPRTRTCTAVHQRQMRPMTTSSR